MTHILRSPFGVQRLSLYTTRREAPSHELKQIRYINIWVILRSICIKFEDQTIGFLCEKISGIKALAWALST